MDLFFQVHYTTCFSPFHAPAKLTSSCSDIFAQPNRKWNFLWKLETLQQQNALERRSPGTQPGPRGVSAEPAGGRAKPVAGREAGELCLWARPGEAVTYMYKGKPLTVAGLGEQ